jgi:hypothetical protein
MSKPKHVAKISVIEQTNPNPNTMAERKFYPISMSSVHHLCRRQKAITCQGIIHPTVGRQTMKAQVQQQHIAKSIKNIKP